MSKGIWCQHCGGAHGSVSEVRVCAQSRNFSYVARDILGDGDLPQFEVEAGGSQGELASESDPFAPSVRKSEVPATDKQVSYLDSLMQRAKLPAMSEEAKSRLSKSDASTSINHLLRDAYMFRGQLVGRSVPYEDPVEKAREDAARKRRSAESSRALADLVNGMIPPPKMVKILKTGRYAVRRSASDPWVFVRIARPKTGKKAGYTKVQTQHSDGLIDRQVIDRADTTVQFSRAKIKGMTLREIVMLILANQNEAALDYGKELGRCCVCGKTLTDDESIRYGVGPECIKGNQWAVTLTHEREEEARGGQA